MLPTVDPGLAVWQSLEERSAEPRSWCGFHREGMQNGGDAARFGIIVG